MKIVARKSLAIIAGISALFSGVFWHVSAKSALAAFSITATTPAAQKAVRDLQYLSMQENLWAAYAAAIAGVALALALIFDD